MAFINSQRHLQRLIKRTKEQHQLNDFTGTPKSENSSRYESVRCSRLLCTLMVSCSYYNAFISVTLKAQCVTLTHIEMM